jgi:hypothetical protein
MAIWCRHWLFLVSAKPSESRCKCLSHKQMDTLHCRQEIAGSAVQFNSSVSAMPPKPPRTFEAPLHPGTADTLLVRWAAPYGR